MTKEEATQLFIKCQSIYRTWRITDAAIYALFEGKINGYNRVKGLHHTTIPLFKNSKNNFNVNHLEEFIREMGNYFNYDFSSNTLKTEQDETSKNKALIQTLKDYKVPQKNKKSTLVEEKAIYSEADKQILKNLEGIYYGYFYDNVKNSKGEYEKNFIFLIKQNGDVQLRAGKAYYSSGKAIIKSASIAFLLNNNNGKPTELYYTNFDSNFDGDDFEVTEMILTGVWSNNKSEPSIGSSLLFKHGTSYKFESASIISEEIEKKDTIKNLNIQKLNIKNESIDKLCLKKLKDQKESGLIYQTISQNKPNQFLIQYKQK